MNFDPSIVSALPASTSSRTLAQHGFVEHIDPSIVTAMPAMSIREPTATLGTQSSFTDPCVVAAQPFGGQDRNVPKPQTVQQLAMQFMAAQVARGPENRQVQFPAAFTLGSLTPVEIAQQQLQQQQHLVRAIQQRQQQAQTELTPQLLQQLQLQQLLQPSMVHLQQQQQLLQQQVRAQQLQLQLRQQQLVQGQQHFQPPQQLMQQQLLTLDPQALAQHQPQQLQLLQQLLQQQVQIQLQQHSAEQGLRVATPMAQNGVHLEPGVYAIPQGSPSVQQQLTALAASLSGVQASVSSPSRTVPNSAPMGDEALTPFLSAKQGTIFGPLKPLPESRQERQPRNRRHVDPVRHQDQQRTHEPATSAVPERAEGKSIPLPVRRPTKALEIVDPKTNAVVQLAPADGKPNSGTPSTAASNKPTNQNDGPSRAIPIIDPKTNAPIPEVDVEKPAEHRTEAPESSERLPTIKEELPQP